MHLLLADLSHSMSELSNRFGHETGFRVQQQTGIQNHAIGQPVSSRWQIPAHAALQPDGFSGEQQPASQHRPDRWSIFFRKCTDKVLPGIVDFFESERLASLRRIGWRFWSGIRSCLTNEYSRFLINDPAIYSNECVLSQSFSAASTRICQPSPVARKA